MERLFPEQHHPRFLLLDGGSGTTLEDEFGCKLMSQVWSSELLLSRPELLSSLHRAWETAGAQIISTASYQGTREGFRTLLSNSNSQETDGTDKSLQLLRSSVSLARDSLVRNDTRVALSLGPYGATLVPGREYSGVYPEPYDSEEKLMNFHFDRLMDYAQDRSTWDKVDLVLFETIPNLTEALAIRRAWKKLEQTLFDHLPEGSHGERSGNPLSSKFWAMSFVFPTPNGQFPTGETPLEVLGAALQIDADLAEPSGIGINCTKLDSLEPILEAWTSSTIGCIDRSKTWLWLYPDGGPTYDPANRSWNGSPITHLEWANQLFTIASKFHDAWAGIVLGCCCKAGTPHIRALHQLLSSSTSVNLQDSLIDT
ncbi:hypothetical protein PSTT_14288 [Puccinia striiformis]|uniref:Hcy-binding domain-containing protein n=1 Tax=Puccinia striiformis TaxID=27350 RepID=A0A2S4UMV6_9BASI|nr:hypothetical protein PSTT_14288 [Puccinia striiformis]